VNLNIKIMKILKLFVSITFFLFASQLFAQEPCSDLQLLENYWNTRDLMRSRFTRNTLDENGNFTSDGIGSWDPVAMRFTDAGYGLPAAHLNMNHHPEWEVDCLSNPSGNNVLSYGADTPYALGQVIALLCTEYELLKQNGQENAAELTLKELFLALQAYRRMDMTANMLMHEYNQNCGDPNCEWEPDLTGYSGFFVRSDVTSDFHTNFDNSNQPDDWQVGGTDGGLVCDDLPCDFILENNVLSQDQVVGMLFGLSFVKKIIKPEIKVTYNSTDYYILEMAQKIAEGMVKRIRLNSSRRIKFPPCYDQSVGIGSYAGGNFYGMEEVLDYIYPENNIGATAGDILAWNTNVSALISCNFNWEMWDNIRMILELYAAQGLEIGYLCGVANDVDVLNMQILAGNFLGGNSTNSGYLSTMRDALCTYNCPGPCYFDPNNVGPVFDCPHEPGDGWCTGERWKKSPKNVFQDCWSTFYNRHSPGYDYMLAYNLLQLQGDLNTGYFNPESIQALDSGNTLPGQEFTIFPLKSSFCNTDIYSFDVEGKDLKINPNTNIRVDLGPGLNIIGPNPTTAPYNFEVEAVANGRFQSFIEIYNADNQTSDMCETNQRIRHDILIVSPLSGVNVSSTIPNHCIPELYVEVWNTDIGSLFLNDNYEVVINVTQGGMASSSYFDGLGILIDIDRMGVPYDIPVLISYDIVVTGPCGVEFTENYTVEYDNCNLGYPEENGCDFCRILISPNPADDQINVELVNFDGINPFIDNEGNPIQLQFNIVSAINPGINAKTVYTNEVSTIIPLFDLFDGYYYLNSVINNEIYQEPFIISRN
jgi:hypothetical protein